MGNEEKEKSRIWELAKAYVMRENNREECEVRRLASVKAAWGRRKCVVVQSESYFTHINKMYIECIIQLKYNQP